MREHPIDDEVALYALIGAVGAIPVVLALWTGEVFNADDTIGLLMVCFSIGGLSALYRAQRARRRDRT